jgi:tetratricopeptide (TPR) repeat protein
MFMRKLFFVFILFSFYMHSFAQDANVQQWKNMVSQHKKDTIALIALDSLQSWYGSSITDSGLYYVQQMKELAEAIDNKKYISNSLRYIAEKYFTEGKTKEALKLQYRALALAEESRDSNLLALAYVQIGHSHKEYGDYKKAFSFYKRTYDIGIQINKDNLVAMGALNLGYTYAQLNQLDSALYYMLQSYSITNSRYKRQMRSVEAYMGYVQYKMGNSKLAKEYYESALERISKTREPLFGSRSIVVNYLGLANCFQKMNNTDSAHAFAQKALFVAKQANYLKGICDAQKLLAETFEEKHKLDSAYYYQKLYIATNDSLYNRDKASAIESLTFDQELQEKERQAEIEKQNEERSHNIQLAMTAIAILSAVILFLLLSRSILVSHKVVEFLSVIVLLVVFEFINLLIHPFLEKITHHSPALMLLGLVLIAAMIVPLHHRLEKLTTKKLVEKNKAVRLANARKTIAELDDSDRQG